jgi:hypothetical protein
LTFFISREIEELRTRENEKRQGTSKNLFPTSASPYFSMVEFVESGVFRSSRY